MSSKSFVDVAISQMTTISSQLLLGQDVHSTRIRINSILDQTLEKPDLGYSKPDFLSLKERITSATSEESCSQVVSSSILLFQKHSFFCSLGTFMSEEDAHAILEAIDPHCSFSEDEISLIVTALQTFSARECLDICSLLVKMPPSKSNGDSFFRFVINVSDLVAPTSRMSVINYFSEMFLSRYTIHQLVLLFAKFNNIEDQGQRHAFFTFVISNFKPENKKRLTLFMAYDALTQKQKEAIAIWYQKIKPEASTQEEKAEILYNLVVVMAPELFVKVDKIFSEQDRSSDVGVVGELLDSIYNFQSIQHIDPLSLDIKEVLQSLDITHPSTYFARLSGPTEEKKYEDQVLIDSLIEFFNEGFDANFPDMIPFLQILDHEKKLHFLQLLSSIRPEFRRSLLREMSIGKDFLTDANLSSLMFLLIFFPDKCKPEVVKALLEREDFTSLVLTDPLSLIKDFLNNPSNEAFRDEVYDHLIREIQSHPSASEAQWITSVLLSNTDSFAIEQGSQLHLLCWSVFIWSKDTGTKKNPYAIYQNIITASKLKAVNTVLYPFSELESQYVSLSVDSFKKCLMQGVSLADVLSCAHGRRYGFSDWSNLLSSILVRIERLAYVRKTRTINEIKLITSSSIATHVDNLNSVVFKNILEEPYKQNVSPVKAMLSSIFTYILDKPDIVEYPNLLSEREKTFFMISESIQNCPVGKIEGIRVVYSLLPEMYKYRQVREDLDVSVQSAQSLVRKFFQHKIEQMIYSDTPFMRELTGQSGYTLQSQLAHQSRYVRNMLYPQLGLSKQLEFDLYTETLSDNLLEVSNTDILEKFFKHLSVEQVIDDFKTFLSREVPPESIFPVFSELIADCEDLEKCWDIDIGKVQITNLGLIRILERSDIFQVSTIREGRADLLLLLEKYIKGDVTVQRSCFDSLPIALKKHMFFTVYDIEKRAGRYRDHDLRFGEHAFFSEHGKSVTADVKFYAINREMANIIIDLYEKCNISKAYMIFKKMSDEFKSLVISELSEKYTSYDLAGVLDLEILFSTEIDSFHVQHTQILKDVIGTALNKIESSIIHKERTSCTTA